MGYQGAGDTGGPTDAGSKAHATLTQLSKRWGVVGGTYWMIEKKAPPMLVVKPMIGREETWELDGPQPGVPYKDKTYRRIK